MSLVILRQIRIDCTPDTKCAAMASSSWARTESISYLLVLILSLAASVMTKWFPLTGKSESNCTYWKLPPANDQTFAISINCRPLVIHQEHFLCPMGCWYAVGLLIAWRYNSYRKRKKSPCPGGDKNKSGGVLPREQSYRSFDDKLVHDADTDISCMEAIAVFPLIKSIYGLKPGFPSFPNSKLEYLHNGWGDVGRFLYLDQIYLRAVQTLRSHSNGYSWSENVVIWGRLGLSCWLVVDTSRNCVKENELRQTENTGSGEADI